MKTKYNNDAIIGNKNMVASFTKHGELLRLFYPNTDYRQFVDFFHTGVTINDSNIIYLHQDINNEYKQQYVENTNILKTEIKNTYFELKIKQKDFVDIREDILVRKYELTNENSIDLDINFIIYSKLLTNSNNDVSGYYKNDSLIQYMHDYSLCILSKMPIDVCQINNTKADLEEGNIGGKDYIGMSPDSSIQYNLGVLKPGEKKEFEIYIFAKENREKNSMASLEEEIERIRKIDFSKNYDNTKKYWRKYVKEHTNLEFKEIASKFDEKIKQIYNRTILLYPLLINQTTGGISAAVEIDENKSNCGRYSFCWPRDAIFITKAMDLLKMEKETEKFYKIFCKNTQSKNGMWEQRFYTDGNLAPCWGYQIDETSAVVFGVYDHYLRTKDEKFLKDNLRMIEKAVSYLKKYIADIIENKNELPKSYDLWEENEGTHTYSLATIFSAFNSIIKIYEILKPSYENNRLKIEQMNNETKESEKLLLDIKEYIIKNFYDNDKKSFVRNIDAKMDISVLGLVEPFKVFTPKDKKMLNTLERMELTLRTYTGGYIRYEGDTYAGGNNPWVIANLWLANYYIEAGEKSKARECFKFVVNTSSEHGFLAEQIDNETLKSKWVNGLGWSHAMFIIVLNRLMKK